MTVKKNSRVIQVLAVLLFSFLVVISGFAQKKNILHIRFETAKIKQGVPSVFLNVFYQMEGTKPWNLSGFDCRYNYDQTKIRPTNAFFDGTASGIAALAHGNDNNNTYHVLVDNYPQSLDTSNHILFQVFYSVKSDFTDSAMIAPILFDVGLSSGIDTVVIDNTGRDDISWFPFGLVFIDTTRPPPPPKKKIFLSSDSMDVQSDSIRIVSLRVSSLDRANMKSSVFEFDYDTSAFNAVTVAKGSLLSGGTLFVSQDTSHIAVKSSNADTSKAFASSGELLQISLTGKKRTDTLCTTLMNPKLTVLNGDNLISSVSYQIGGICVLGKQADTVTKGVAGSGDASNVQIGIFPNPARSFIDFIMPEGQAERKHLVVADALGRKIFDRIFDADFQWDIAWVPAGLYTAIVTDLSSLQKGKAAYREQKILIVH